LIVAFAPEHLSGQRESLYKERVHLIIPPDQLNSDTLTALIEEFVSRDGTDYGNQEISLASKVEQVRSKLTSGEAVILFSESKGLCNIVSKDML